MKYLAAYALCQLSGEAPTKKAVEAVLKAAGVAVDGARLDALFKEFEGKNFDEVVANGKKKPSGVDYNDKTNAYNGTITVPYKPLTPVLVTKENAVTAYANNPTLEKLATDNK